MMKSLIYSGAGEVVLAERPIPAIDAGEALIKVSYVGVCGTDMLIYQGAHPRAKAPLIMGHELAGTLVVGHPTLPAGTPVTVYPLLSCGQCEPCRGGYAHVCDRLRLLGIDCDGGMAEYLKAPADKVLAIPRDLPLKLGAFIEPLAVGVHAVRRSGYRPGDSAVVFGAGPIGLCVASCLKYFGAAPVLVSEASACRLELACALGFRVIDALNDDVCGKVRDATQGGNADLAFDCAAHPDVPIVLTEVLKVRGTGVIVGSYRKPAEVDLLKLEFKELALLGTRVYERRDFEIAIRLLESRVVDFDRLLTVAEPASAPERFRALQRGDGGVIKMLFKM